MNVGGWLLDGSGASEEKTKGASTPESVGSRTIKAWSVYADLTEVRECRHAAEAPTGTELATSSAKRAGPPGCWAEAGSNRIRRCEYTHLFMTSVTR